MFSLESIDNEAKEKFKGIEESAEIVKAIIEKEMENGLKIEKKFFQSNTFL